MNKTQPQQRPASRHQQRGNFIRHSDCNRSYDDRCTTVGPGLAGIAELPARVINRMKRDDLIRLVEESGLISLCPNLSTHIHYSDRATLLQLAHLGQRCCRNRTKEHDRTGSDFYVTGSHH